MRAAGAGADVPEDDGFSWRKYGQKEILGAQYPRLVLAHLSTQVYLFSEPNPHMFSEVANEIFSPLDFVTVDVLFLR
jgi:hypothetical protein